MKDDDFKLFRGFADGRTFVNVESLSRLKIPVFFMRSYTIPCNVEVLKDDLLLA